MPRISIDNREKILSLWRNGLSLRKIGNNFNCSYQAVLNIIRKHNAFKSVDDRPKSGRPKKTSAADDRQMRRFVSKNRFSTAAEVKIGVNLPSNISLRLIQRRLFHFDLKCYRAAHKPMVSRINRIKRKKFSKKYAKWSLKDWKRVAFTDESRFSLFGSDSQYLVRRNSNERLASNCVRKCIQGRGGSVMAWGVVTYKGPGPLVFLDKNLNGQTYLNLLENEFLPYYENNLPLNTIFQQDNAPPHRCQTVEKFIDKNIIYTLPWPPQSPDLNVIENVWQYVKRQLKYYKSTNKRELMKNIEIIWQSVPVTFIRRLIESMPRRIDAVDKSKGYPTKY